MWSLGQHYCIKKEENVQHESNTNFYLATELFPPNIFWFTDRGSSAQSWSKMGKSLTLSWTFISTNVTPLHSSSWRSLAHSPVAHARYLSEREVNRLPQVPPSRHAREQDGGDRIGCLTEAGTFQTSVPAPCHQKALDAGQIRQSSDCFCSGRRAIFAILRRW